jgi:hypothetical protein
MTKKIMRLVIILPLLAIAFLLAAWTLASDASWQKLGPSTTKTLRQIARERDFEGEVPMSESNTEYDDLRLLSKNSDAIVIGHIVQEESAFSGDDHIVTTYLVDVNRILSDRTAEVMSTLKILGEQEPPAPLSTPLKVVRDGGVVTRDGHRVTRTLRGSEAVKVGQDYILFVHWSRDFKAYRLAGGISGVVLVGPDLVVKPLGSGKGVRKHRGAPLEAFVKEILADQ